MAHKVSRNCHKQTITITFGDRAENHVGMQCIGKMNINGFNVGQLMAYKTFYEQNGRKCELIDLRTFLPSDAPKEKLQAYVLVVRNIISDSDTNFLWNELISLPWDQKALMRGRVVDKHARWNLIFGDTPQDPEYEKGKGRIIPWTQLPILSEVRNHVNKLSNFNYVAEGNYYYDTQKCGIGWHGDTERRLVIGLRLGTTMPLCFNWFHQHKSQGTICNIILNSGDMYFMDDKACGHDWKSSSQWTLRHCAGCSKYTTPKSKE